MPDLDIDMEESKPNYEMEKVVMGEHEFLKDPFSGNLSLKTPKATLYFSPHGEVLEIKPHYIRPHHHLNPSLLFDFKAGPILYELLDYEERGRPTQKKLEKSRLKIYGLAITNFIKGHFSAKIDPFYTLQKNIWRYMMREKIKEEGSDDSEEDPMTEDLIEKIILGSCSTCVN